MQLRPARAARWLLAFALLVALGLVVGRATAAPGTDLTDPNVRVMDNFYPCPGQTDFTRGPLVSECYDASAQPLAFPAVGLTGVCDPGNTSTIHVDRTTGSAFVPDGTPWLSGTVHWDLTATIDTQGGPAMPEIQPFPFDGTRIGSFGFQTGALTLTGTVKIDTGGDATPEIEATVSTLPNAGNWGLCRTLAQEPSGADPGGGSAPVTGSFDVFNAGVLSYHVTTGPSGLAGETGSAEAYFTNALATCCNATPPGPGNPADFVAPATGGFRLQFGSTRPAEGTTASAPTAPDPAHPNDPVTVTNFSDLPAEVGGVKLTFSTVTAPGETTVTLLTSMPDQPSGFQVGDPPAVYEISTTAGVTAPITVCLPYGSLPAGVTPQIRHFVGGAWETVATTTITGLPDQLVCGQVTSLSPFAVGYFPYTVAGPFRPVDPLPKVNPEKAGRTVPVKFSLGGDFGLGVFADGYPASQAVDCQTGAPTGGLEPAAPANSGLSYDAVSATYQLNWKTSSGWKGQCRTLILRFDSGQELRAAFRFG